MRNTAKTPSPLIIEQVEALNAQPESTTAKFKEYVQHRNRILQIPSSQLRKLSEHEREDKIYQYLTPDEIWMLKDALKKTPPVNKIDISSISFDDSSNEKHTTVEDYILHEQKRREFKEMTDDDLRKKSVAELEYYYQFLTTDELLVQNEKLAQMKL